VGNEGRLDVAPVPAELAVPRHRLGQARVPRDLLLPAEVVELLAVEAAAAGIRSEAEIEGFIQTG
jgi:hypothetical protein